MTVPSFPDSPTNGQTFTENGITYTWVENGAETGYWAASGESITLQSVTTAGSDTTNDITTRDVSIQDGNNLILQNDDQNQTISINADDCEASYTVTLPPTAPTEDGQVLRVNTGTTDAELEWGTIAAPAGTPAGSIIMFGGATAPEGWLICDGSAVSRTTQANLFTAIGTAFGSGDGSTTFNLPNMRGQFPRGLNTTGSGNDPNRTLGTTQAQATAVNGMSISDPGHTHSFTTRNQDGSESNIARSASSSNGVASVTVNSATTRISFSSSSSDNETRPTNVALNFIIRT